MNQKSEKALEILTDTDNGGILIHRDDNKQIVRLDDFDFEIDEENNHIYFEVHYEPMGKGCFIELRRYKNNLTETIKNLLNEHDIDCKVNFRLGKIRILN